MEPGKISIILAEPLYPGNIGSVARAMKNFGFSKLVLVNSCKITEEARKMAVHAQDILDCAKMSDNFEKEIEKYDLIIGTSAKKTLRDDYFLRMSLTPAQMRKKIETAQGKIGLVLGREDIGLTNEQLELCDFVVSIPTYSKYKTMNISHSAAILFYELSRTSPRGGLTKRTKAGVAQRVTASRSSMNRFRLDSRDATLCEGGVRLASSKEKELFYKNFDTVLKKSDYPADKHRIFKSMLRKIIGRAVLTGREVSTLIGAVKKIKRRLGNL